MKTPIINDRKLSKGGGILDKNRRIQSFLNDIRENNSIIHISTTLVPSIDISIDDGQIYEIIEKSLENWLEERIDCTNF